MVVNKRRRTKVSRGWTRMKKTFELDWDENIVIDEGDIQRALVNTRFVNSLKVKEIITKESLQVDEAIKRNTREHIDKVEELMETINPKLKRAIDVAKNEVRIHR